MCYIDFRVRSYYSRICAPIRYVPGPGVSEKSTKGSTYELTNEECSARGAYERITCNPAVATHCLQSYDAATYTIQYRCTRAIPSLKLGNRSQPSALERPMSAQWLPMEWKNLDPACMFTEGCLCENCRGTITPAQPKAGDVNPFATLTYPPSPQVLRKLVQRCLRANA